ncbi:hypothetical protein CGLO_01184 [Colletotrichum gloeosporioides Cg-14]|uniref:Uncharacterized protein n=1 Tax=Colletotrichum gloeosporioides (strain Cg-14) TaxID=1237896 RepID=T0MC57_COLGC|nr:hypothetical protein CGLO_01184 [Colletotrichum gloeosporioides Cg-14]
MVISNSSSFC